MALVALVLVVWEVWPSNGSSAGSRPVYSASACDAGARRRGGEDFSGEPSGEARDMTLVEVSDADFERAREVLVNTVLPDWAERAGDEWYGIS